MRKKDKTYSVIIISDSTSANKEFTISSKLIKKVLISTFLLLFILGFIIFDYLTISFDKVRMKGLEQKIITLQNERNKADLSTEKNLNNKLKSIKKEINEITPTLQKSKKEYSEYLKIFSDHDKKVYDEIYKKRIWKERIIGLFMAIISAAIVKLIFWFFKIIIKKKHIRK